MRKALHLEGVLWVVVGSVVALAALRLPLGDAAAGGVLALPGPGFFPLLLAGALIALGVIVALRPAAPAVAPAPATRIGARGLAVVVGLLLYAALFERLGFVLSTFLFLTVLFRGVSERGVLASIGIAAATSVAAWIVFGVWLRAQLPSGLLAFP